VCPLFGILGTFYLACLLDKNLFNQMEKKIMPKIFEKNQIIQSFLKYLILKLPKATLCFMSIYMIAFTPILAAIFAVILTLSPFWVYLKCTGKIIF